MGSNIGFVIDNVGEQCIQEQKIPEIANIFEKFIQEKNMKHSSTASQNERKISAFEKFSADMNFTTDTTISKKAEKARRKNEKNCKLNTEEFTKDKAEIEKILAKSDVLQEGFDKLKAIPSQVVTEKKLKQQRKFLSEKSKGKKWFNMPATELTEEVKKDLEVLQMRSVLDPKHFYKKNDLKVLPKYFQVGKVQDSPLDFYNNRLTKKERKRTLVDELLADAEFTKYNKKKYAEILVEKQKTHYKAFRQAKRLKKKGTK